VKRYRVSKAAEQDLDSLFVFWAKRAGLEVSDRLVDEITSRFWLLGEHSEAGVTCDDIAPGVQSFPAGKYLIYYRKRKAGVEILHVFHGHKDQRKAGKARRHSLDFSARPAFLP
jgi:toxin ParE1/3/4